MKYYDKLIVISNKICDEYMVLTDLMQNNFPKNDIKNVCDKISNLNAMEDEIIEDIPTEDFIDLIDFCEEKLCSSITLSQSRVFNKLIYTFEMQNDLEFKNRLCIKNYYSLNALINMFKIIMEDSLNLKDTDESFYKKMKNEFIFYLIAVSHHSYYIENKLIENYFNLNNAENDIDFYEEKGVYLKECNSLILANASHEKIKYTATDVVNLLFKDLLFKEYFYNLTSDERLKVKSFLEENMKYTENDTLKIFRNNFNERSR